MRVKSVTSSTRGGKGTIRIELETNDLPEMGYALERINEVQTAQATPKGRLAKRQLALPAPGDFA